MKAKVRNAQLASRLGGEPKQWRGPRRNRFQGSIIKKKILDSENFQLSSALARMYTALEQGGRGSPSAAIGVVLDDNGESPVVGGWIRKTHLSEQNRRSPIFTGRFFGRDELDDSNPRRGGQFGPHERSGGPQMGNSSRPSISERLGPRVESPSREQFDSQNASQWSYHKANRQYEPAGPRYGEDYPPGRYSRDHFSPQPQRSQDYGRSQADYHSDYYGSSERDASRDPRPMQWNQRSDYDYPAGYPEYDDRMNGDYRRRSEDYNNGPYSRDNYPPQSARRSYRQALYYPPSYTSPRQEYMMDQRQMGSRQDQPSDNYSAYPPNYRDSYYDDERRNAWHSYSNSQMDDYNSNMGQQRPRNFRESTYYSQDMSSPRYDSMMMQQQQQQQRSWMEPPMNRPGPGKQGFYQDR